MHPHETTIFFAVLTAAVILCLLIIFFVVNIAVYHRRRRLLTIEKISGDLLLLEKEQARIALDLHDDIGTTLTGIKLQLEMGKPAGAAQQLELVIEKVRNMAVNMLPETLEKQGLKAALEKLRYTMPVKIQLSFNIPFLAEEKELHIFRMVQEMLANTIKHAGASEVVLSLYQSKHKIIIRCRDNGKGFDRDKIFAHPKGSGLKNIQARADILNASVYLITRPGQGVVWQLELPI